MRDKEEEKLSCVSRYFDPYLVELGSFGCLGLKGLAHAAVTYKLRRGSNVCTYNVCSCKWLCPNLAGLLSSRCFCEELSYSQKRMWFWGVKKDLLVFLQNYFISVHMYGFRFNTHSSGRCCRTTAWFEKKPATS